MGYEGRILSAEHIAEVSNSCARAVIVRSTFRRRGAEENGSLPRSATEGIADIAAQTPERRTT
eukprot:1667628-Alexandrium_andersonii.AAC.1